MAGPPRWISSLNVILLRAGLQVGTQHVLTIPGRKTGIKRSIPVSVVTLDDVRFIVAGADLKWPANARAAKSVELERGGRREEARLTELPPAERGRVLLAFWDQVRGGRRFVAAMLGLPADAGPDDVERAAPRLPVFRIDPT